MPGAIIQIVHCLTNIFVRHPGVSLILPILDGMGTGVLAPAYRLRRVFRRLSSQFVLSISQMLLAFLDLNLELKESLNSLIFLIGPNFITIIGWESRLGMLIGQDNHSWSCVPSSASTDVLLQASALLQCKKHWSHTSSATFETSD